MSASSTHKTFKLHRSCLSFNHLGLKVHASSVIPWTEESREAPFEVCFFITLAVQLEREHLYKSSGIVIFPLSWACGTAAPVPNDLTCYHLKPLSCIIPAWLRCFLVLWTEDNREAPFEVCFFNTLAAQLEKEHLYKSSSVFLSSLHGTTAQIPIDLTKMFHV